MIKLLIVSIATGLGLGVGFGIPAAAVTLWFLRKLELKKQRINQGQAETWIDEVGK